MQAGADTPEELETLFEDTLVLGDGQALAALFEAGAVLLAEGQAPVHGSTAIAQTALAQWSGEQTYVADPQRIVQTRDIALIVTEHGINVARRTRDGAWCYVIVFVDRDPASEAQRQAVAAESGER
jgi:hypothetical protein